MKLSWCQRRADVVTWPDCPACLLNGNDLNFLKMVPVGGLHKCSLACINRALLMSHTSTCYPNCWAGRSTSPPSSTHLLSNGPGLTHPPTPGLYSLMVTFDTWITLSLNSVQLKKLKHDLACEVLFLNITAGCLLMDGISTFFFLYSLNPEQFCWNWLELNAVVVFVITWIQEI